MTSKKNTVLWISKNGVVKTKNWASLVKTVPENNLRFSSSVKMPFRSKAWLTRTEFSIRRLKMILWAAPTNKKGLCRSNPPKYLPGGYWKMKFLNCNSMTTHNSNTTNTKYTNHLEFLLNKVSKNPTVSTISFNASRPINRVCSGS